MRFSWRAIWLEEREHDLRRQARARSIGTPQENSRQFNRRRTESRPAAATLGTSRTTLDPHPLLSPMLPPPVSEVKSEPFLETQSERARPSPASPSAFRMNKRLRSTMRFRRDRPEQTGDEALELFVDRQMAELMVENWDRDEPDSAGELYVEPVELETSPN